MPSTASTHSRGLDADIVDAVPQHGHATPGKCGVGEDDEREAEPAERAADDECEEEDDEEAADEDEG